MHLQTNKIKVMMIFALILSFITQPTLAASLSTAMQLAPSMAQMNKNLPLSKPSKESECAHMMMMEQSSTSAERKDKSNSEPHKNCLTTCQFCMSIAFILPHNLDIMPNKEALIVHAVHVQNPTSLFHVPAYEPPRLAS